MRVMKYLSLILVIYVATGAGLLYSGVLHQWPIGYKTYIKYKKNRDSSAAGTDGPWVMYTGQKVLVKQLITDAGHLRPVTDTLKQKVQVKLTCHVTETGDTFGFGLKDTLKIQPAEYPATEQLLVLSDIEGNFKGFKQILVYSGVISRSLAWTYGKGHLVLVGDFFDRGLQVTECLWLIYKMEQEAEKAGGKVHFILGNHDIMNLTNDHRYVRKKYLNNAQLINIPYGLWYAADTELGRWLRTKNVIEKIGPLAFVHGGISPSLAQKKLSLTQINRQVRAYLNSAGAARPAADDLVLGREGVYWYRGLALQHPQEEEVTQILNNLHASRLIIGHTIQSEIRSYYNGRIIAIDLPHQENSEKGFMQALMVKKETLYAISTTGERRLIK